MPQLDEQMTEGTEWISGNFDSPLGERTATQLVEARGLENSDEFCLNSSCHPYTRDELEKKTAWMGKINRTRRSMASRSAPRATRLTAPA